MGWGERMVWVRERKVLGVGREWCGLGRGRCWVWGENGVG